MDVETYALRGSLDNGDIPTLLRGAARSWASAVLDVGCGDGRLIAALEREGLLAGRRVIGLDASATAIGRARAWLPGVDWRIDDATRLETVPDGEIDLAICNQVIEHVSDDGQALRELRRVLRPGGLAFVATVLKGPWAWWYQRCNGKWALDPTHVREYRHERELLDKAEGAGLELVRQRVSPLCVPFLDAALRKLGAPRDVYRLRPWLSSLRLLQFRYPGYRLWELLLRRPAGTAPS